MKTIKLILYFIIIINVTACQKVNSPSAEFDRAVIITPKGEVKLNQTKKHPHYLKGNDDFPIGINIFPLHNISRIDMRGIKNPTKINTEQAYYQLNNGKKNTLNIENARKEGSFLINTPPTMDFFSRDGDGLHITRKRQKISSKHKSKMKKETYRYYIPFSIDDESYAFDIVFRLKINTSRRIGIPGGTP